MKRPLILASTSLYRRAVLERLGIEFTCVAPESDESNPENLPPTELPAALARRKARSVRVFAPNALIIGSDQLVECQGEVFGKPGTAAQAAAQLLHLQGRRHRLITAVAVYDPLRERVLLDTDIHTLSMRALSAAQITAYINHDNPVDCAGSYKLEKRGIALFERIEADAELADATAVQGLPLARLCRLLQQCDVDVLVA